MNFNLEDYAVPGTNGQAFYIPNFVTEQEGIILLQKVCVVLCSNWFEIGDHLFEMPITERP